MLTGDKLETATCIAQSSRLVSRHQTIYTFNPVKSSSHTIHVHRAFIPVHGRLGRCLSRKLVASTLVIFIFLSDSRRTRKHQRVVLQVHNRAEAHLELNSLRRKNDCALIIKGDSLEVRTSLPWLLNRASALAVAPSAALAVT